MKKIIYTFILLSTLIFADTIYFHVQSPEEVDSYVNIFNGIAKIFGSNDYLGLLKLVFLFGGFFVFISGLITSWGSTPSKPLSAYFRFIIIGTGLLTIIFAATDTVVVKTDNLPTYCTNNNSSISGAAVDNVPQMVAFTFNFFNRVGSELTRLTEIGFIPPNNIYGDLSIQNNEGYMGALKQSMSVLGMDLSTSMNTGNNGNGNTLTAYDLQGSIQTIFSQCIFIPFSSKGISGQDEITKIKASRNLRTYLTDLYSGSHAEIGGLSPRDYTAKFSGEVWKCGELWDQIEPNLTIFGTNVACNYPGVNAGAIRLITGNQNPPPGVMQSVSIQSGLISEAQNSASKLGTGISGLAYANGKSKSEFVQTKMAEGAFQAEFLPQLQSTLRALLYAMLPFMFVIALLPGGLRIIGEYLRSVLWIELWTPTAAVLNMLVLTQAENKMTGEYTSNGLSIVNSVDYLTTGSTLAGTAGYLYASVPGLTWLFLTGSEFMLTKFGDDIAKNMQKNIKTESINKDVTEVKKAAVIQSRTGEEFSVAESQHFEALKMGAESGGTLAVESNLGLEKTTNAAMFKTSKELAETDSTIKGLGGGAITAGTITGQGEAIRTITNAKGAAPLTNSDGTLSKRGETVVQQDAQVIKSEQKAKVENNLSERITDNAESHRRAQKFNKSSAAIEQTMKSTGKGRVGAAKHISTIEGVDKSIKASKTDKEIELKTGAKANKQTIKTAKAGVKRVEAEAVTENYETLSRISKVNKLSKTLTASEHGNLSARNELQRLGKINRTTEVYNSAGQSDFEGAYNSAEVSVVRNGVLETGIFNSNGELKNGKVSSFGVTYEQSMRNEIGGLNSITDMSQGVQNKLKNPEKESEELTDTGDNILKSADFLNEMLTMIGAIKFASKLRKKAKKHKNKKDDKKTTKKKIKAHEKATTKLSATKEKLLKNKFLASLGLSPERFSELSEQELKEEIEKAKKKAEERVTENQNRNKNIKEKFKLETNMRNDNAIERLERKKQGLKSRRKIEKVERAIAELKENQILINKMKEIKRIDSDKLVQAQKSLKNKERAVKDTAKAVKLGATAGSGAVALRRTGVGIAIAATGEALSHVDTREAQVTSTFIDAFGTVGIELVKEAARGYQLSYYSYIGNDKEVMRIQSELENTNDLLGENGTVSNSVDHIIDAFEKDYGDKSFWDTVTGVAGVVGGAILDSGDYFEEAIHDTAIDTYRYYSSHSIDDIGNDIIQIKNDTVDTLAAGQEFARDVAQVTYNIAEATPGVVVDIYDVGVNIKNGFWDNASKIR